MVLQTCMDIQSCVLLRTFLYDCGCLMIRSWACSPKRPDLSHPRPHGCCSTLYQYKSVVSTSAQYTVGPLQLPDNNKQILAKHTSSFEGELPYHPLSTNPSLTTQTRKRRNPWYITITNIFLQAIA